MARSGSTSGERGINAHIADDFAAIAANVAADQSVKLPNGGSSAAEVAELPDAPPAAEAQSDWVIGDLECVVGDLRATVGIMGHLITANSSVNNEVDDYAWRKVESDLLRLANRVEQLWQIAWDQHVTTAAEHKAALADAKAAIAAAKAEAAPGSPTDIKNAKMLWSMLRAMANATLEQCDEAQGIAAKQSAELAR